MFSLFSKKLFALVSLLILSLLFSGCGVWRNFTTYFNTYYNAKTLFDQTEETIIKQKKDIFLFRPDQQNSLQSGQFNSSQTNGINTQGNQFGNQQQFGQNQNNQQQFGMNQNNGQQQFGQSGLQTGILATGNVNQDLTKVIEKCSKILQYETKSGYFPDVLFIAGKALYYQQEYSKAQRKFIELAGLGETSYSLINKLWLAKTDLQLFNIEDGLKLIEEVKAQSLQENEKSIYSDAVITKISLFIYREEFTKAVEECKTFLETSKDDEMKGLVSSQLGKIYVRMGDEQNALTTYEQVLKYDPTIEVELKSKIEHAKLLKQLNKIDESQAELETMRDQGKFRNNLDEIYIELGNVYVAQNQIAKAIDLFKIVDTTYKTLPTGGTASLRLAEVYWNKLRDLDSAQKYYAKVATAFLPNDVKKAADISAKNLVRYFSYKEEYTNLTTKLGYILDPSKYIRDSIDYAIAAKDVIDEGTLLMEKQTAQNPVPAGTDVSAQRLAQAKLTQDQLLQQQLQLLLAERQRQKQKNPLAVQQKAISLKDLIILGKAKKPEKMKATADSAKQMIAANLFNQGSLFFSELDFPDSALVYFKTILNNYSTNKTVIPQTLYSLGTYYETHKDSLKADSLFKIIYDKYPKDKLWEPSARKLGLIKKEAKTTQIAGDDLGGKSYLEGENLYFKKNYTEAVDTFYSIYRKYPSSSYTPKALYFIGMIYEDNLKNNDSAAVAYGILSEGYSTNPVAKDAVAKYFVYKGEKERLKLEAEAKKKEEERKQKEAEDKLKAEQDKLATAASTEASKEKPAGVNEQAKPLIAPVTAQDSTKRIAITDSTKKILLDTTKKAVLPDSTKNVLQDSTKIKANLLRKKREE